MKPRLCESCGQPALEIFRFCQECLDRRREENLRAAVRDLHAKLGVPDPDADSIEACRHCGEARSEASQRCRIATEHEWQWTSGLWEKLSPPHVRWALRNDPEVYEQVRKVLLDTLSAHADKLTEEFRKELEKRPRRSRHSCSKKTARQSREDVRAHQGSENSP